MMNFQIIVSYAKEDNTADSNQQIGWVDSFMKNANLMFGQILDANIELIPISDTDNLTVDQLKSATAMICIVSPSYIEHSHLLEREKDFIDSLKSSGKNATPVYYAYKNHVDTKDLEIESTHWYPMFRYNEESNESEEVMNLFAGDAERLYWMKLVDLVYDVHDLLIGLSSGKMKVMRPYDNNKTVFLASTSNDISTERNILKRELQRHGYTIIPDAPLPTNIEDFQSAMGQLLKKIDFSIHLIGRQYGKALEGSDLSTIESQYRLISDWSKNLAESSDHNYKQLRRFIWIAPNQSRLDTKQDLFVENIKRDFTTVEGVDVIETSLEDFKNMIREELYHDENNHKETTENLVNAVSGDKSVYLIYNKNKPETLDTIKSSIKKKNIKILEPEYDEDVLKTRYQHLENLVNMDYALIIQDSSSDEWARIKLLDIFKSPGYGRLKPIQNIGLVTQNDLSINQTGLPDQNIAVINANSDKELADDIGVFLDKKQEEI